MKGDIRIVKGAIGALSGLPEFLKEKSEHSRTIYLVLRDLLESERINQLFRDFRRMVGVPVALIDLDANVLASSGWERLCTDFHRTNAGTCARCIESDTELANRLEAGNRFTMYRCRNGLTDCASPVVIDGEHVANLFIGQFLLEPPDRGFFRRQAEEFGFPLEEYLAALDEVPVVAEARMPAIMDFLVHFAQLVAAMGMEKLHTLAAEEKYRRHLEAQVHERTLELERKAEQLTREVVERKRAEQALQESERFLEATGHTAGVGGWELDVDSGEMRWTRETFRIHEVPEDRQPDLDEALEFFPPHDRKRLSDALDRAIQHGEAFNLEVRFVTAKGNPLWARAICEPLQEGGRTVKLRGIFQDVTVRKRAQEALDQFKTTLDLTLDCVFMFDPDTLKFFYVNRGATEQVGYSYDEMMEMSPLDIKPEFDEPRFRAMTEEIIASPSRARTFITVHRHKNGTLVPVEIVQQYIAPEDEPPRFVSIVRDITERQRIENELLQHRDHLEQLVESRTTELQESKEAAVAANRAKSVFLANMSHELRTPLNAILGFAQLMSRNRRIPEDERQNLDTINRSGQHLLSLINDVLEISRIEAGRLEVKTESFDLHNLLATLAAVMHVRAQGKGLALRLEQSPDLPRFIKTDVTKLRQILINLISNAVKFTEQGEIRIDADFRKEGEKAILTVEVADTGTGISSPDLERIFHAFYQTGYGVKVGEGTGLGLTISKEYAELLGGTLSAESAPGRGSIFHLRVPVEPERPPDTGQRQRGRVIGLAQGQPACRILVAEDNPDNQRLIATLLERTGFRVRLADDGREAVELARTWHPQCVCMDMRMPTMDGYEATRRIKAIPEGSKISIVALTASAFEEDREAILATGCDAFVRKPLEAQELFEIIGNLLDVRYRYEGTTAAEGFTPVPGELDLQGLPAELLAELEQAALELEVNRINGVVERIRNFSPSQADALHRVVDEFLFDEILAAVQKAG